jgi:hypothetical protein
VDAALQIALQQMRSLAEKDRRAVIRLINSLVAAKQAS